MKNTEKPRFKFHTHRFNSKFEMPGELFLKIFSNKNQKIRKVNKKTSLLIVNQGLSKQQIRQYKQVLKLNPHLCLHKNYLNFSQLGKYKKLETSLS